MPTYLFTHCGRLRRGHGWRGALAAIRSAVICLLTGLVILPVALVALAWYLASELGQTIWSKVTGHARHRSSFGHATGYAMRPRDPAAPGSSFLL